MSVTASPAPGSTFPIGLTRVGRAAADAAPHAAAASVNVTVRDPTAPGISNS